MCYLDLFGNDSITYSKAKSKRTNKGKIDFEGNIVDKRFF